MLEVKSFEERFRFGCDGEVHGLAGTDRGAHRQFLRREHVVPPSPSNSQDLCHMLLVLLFDSSVKGFRLVFNGFEGLKAMSTQVGRALGVARLTPAVRLLHLASCCLAHFLPLA